MKLLNFKQDGEIRLGIKTEEGIIDTTSLFDSLITMEEVISQGTEGLTELQDAIQNATVSYVDESTLTYAPVVTSPEKIICVGLNYAKHAAEANLPVPTSPVLFSKFNNALAAHREIIELPKNGEKFDYEAELVIVIGKTAKNVSEEEALDYVFGYSVGNDFSERGFQFRTSQWLLGKTGDQYAPVGPYLVTADEIDDIHNLKIECKVNGVTRQSENTKDMIFNCSEIVSYASQYMTLKPGDLIYTGTPSGVIVGYPEEEQIWLKSGDEVTISIEKLGSLTNVLE
ncbi:fumarylacetoacetate hydrolase family protein [Bacillus sp. JJ1566]|uniref:fumarylacetoacetate hydrolase family protein n=1 Tax=Bacillus sp. JJ1566 TaxID=3122961 RepID=UPI002FFF9F96